MTRNLPVTEWGKLTKNHRHALRILNEAQPHSVQPCEPQAMRTALHDLWRFGFADRKFQDGMPMTYQITFLGIRAHNEAKGGDAAVDRAADAPEWDDADSPSILLTIGDLRKARAALAHSATQEKADD